MPKSKRNKQIELAKTKKRGLEWKKRLFEEIRTSVDSYSNVFVFSVNDMRNSKMKTVRQQWKHSRFFIGKNKIMAMALGRFAEEEYKPNLHKIGQRIKGQRGLLFSNKCTEEVLSWFRSYSEGDYARSGNTATDDVKLDAGPLPQFPHNLEPNLRQLGLPTSLVKGVIHLVKDHEVCKAGDILTPETAKIIKLLGYEMAEFHITIDCMWSQDGSFMQFTEDVDTHAKENIKKRKSSLTKVDGTANPPDMEEMEVEDDHNLCNSSEYKNVEVLLTTPNTMIEEIKTNTSPTKILAHTNTSTPKEKTIDLKENGVTFQECSILVSEKEGIGYFNDTPKIGKKRKIVKPSEEVNINENDEVNISEENEMKVNEEDEMLVNEEDEVIVSEENEMKVNEEDEMLVNEEDEVIVSEKDEVIVGEKDEVIVSEKDEVIVSEKDEVIVSEKDEVIVSEKDEVIVSEKDEVIVSEKDEAIVSEKDEAIVNEKDEAIVNEKGEVIVNEKDEVNVNDEDEVNANNEEESDTRPSRSCKRKIIVNTVALKKDSLPVTPDIANSSQDSPVFRELRNRSVKVSRKRK